MSFILLIFTYSCRQESRHGQNHLHEVPLGAQVILETPPTSLSLSTVHPTPSLINSTRHTGWTVGQAVSFPLWVISCTPESLRTLLDI